MIEYAEVDVKDITSTVARSSFSEEEINQMADLILESGGVLHPLILEEVSVNQYELVEGAFAFHAATRAREKDPRRGEMVNAFIVKSEIAEMAQQQLLLLRKGITSSDLKPSTIKNPPNPTDQTAVDVVVDTGRQASVNQLSAFINNFVVGSEARLSEMREQLFQAKREWEGRLAKLESVLAAKKQQDLLEVINSLPEEELIARLTFHGLDKAKAQAIAEARQSKAQGRFESYLDLLGTKGLGDKGLVRLIDHWQQLQKL